VNFRQIKLDEWVKDDYRELAHIDIKSSDLAEKFCINFEDYWADGLGNSKIAFFVLDEKIQFYITEFPFCQVVQTYIGCLESSKTLAEDLDNILESLELTSKNILFLYKEINFHPHELWRQDDNGHKFLIETFPCKADAVKAMKEFETRHYKQIYWIEKIKIVR
jgi:hypothetical protein